VIGAANSMSMTGAMNKKIAWIFFGLLTLVAVAAGAALYQTRLQLREMRAVEVSQITALVKDYQSLLERLRITGSSVLGSNLAAIRADGVAKHADVKQRLNQLAETSFNTTACWIGGTR
jgi:hypothetical protein